MSTTSIAPKPKAATLKDLIQTDGFKDAIRQALPKHLSPDRQIRVAITAMTKTPKLADCDQASFCGALLTLSQLGLEPDGRRAHLIPFNNNKRGVTECQLIVDFKGLVELAMRSGQVSTIHADLVCENDEFTFDRGQIVRHAIDFRKPRGDAYAVYAICKFKDGGEKCEVMTRDEVEGIRKRSRAGQSGPWVTDWNEMAKKTVFRRLSKWLPLSSEFHDALSNDADSLEEKRIEAMKPAIKTPLFALPPVAEPTAPEPEPNDIPGDPATAQPTMYNPQASTPTPQDQLADWVTIEHRSTFDQFKDALVNLQFCKGSKADAWTGFEDVSDALVAHCLLEGNREKLKQQLQLEKERADA